MSTVTPNLAFERDWLRQPLNLTLGHRTLKLYKYRDFSHPTEEDFQRLSNVLSQNVFWCAAPAVLNDTNEFSWRCDYQLTDATIPLLAKLLIQLFGRTPAQAQERAAASVSNGNLEVIVSPIINSLIEQCRSEIGLACFSSSSDNEVLWQRYGGAGAGICIEIDAPSELLNRELFTVQYPLEKVLHIDQLLQSFLDTSQVPVVYSVALLSKTPNWSPESEIRFVAKKQNVSVRIEGSRISCVVLGPHLSHEAQQRIESIINSCGLTLHSRGTGYASPSI
jgi:hypothetical protein